MIDRRAEVAMSLEQRPVEIEPDDVERKISHRQRRYPPFFQPQPIGAIGAQMRDFAAVILAAGKGTRMKSALDKVLHPIGGRPMLHHLMASVDALGPSRTVVVVGSGREQIEAAVSGRATTALQEPQLGTGHAVQQA